MRARARTETRLLDAAERLILRAGPQAVGVNAIAHEARVDKVLIYRYFGGLDNLLAKLGARRPLSPSADGAAHTDLEGENHSLADFTLATLRQQIDELRGNPLARRALAWELLARNGLTDVLAAARSARQNATRDTVAARFRSPPYVDHAALVALLEAGITYLALLADAPEPSPSHSFPLTTDAAWHRLDRTLSAILRTLLESAEE